MTPQMLQLLDFCDACERIRARLVCPACVIPLERRRGFNDPFIVTEPQCGALLCLECGYVMVVPRGGRAAVDPPRGLLRRLLRSDMGEVIEECQRLIRLRNDGLSQVRFRVKTRK